MRADDTNGWRHRVLRAVERVGTPCYVSAWQPVAHAVARIDALTRGIAAPRLRSWLSFKTHPLPALANEWLRSGRDVEVVSEAELLALVAIGCPTDRLLVNGVAKHVWLARYPVDRLRVHFDSIAEIEPLLPMAVQHRWRVGIRVHAPDECDARDPSFGSQFGLTADEAVCALNLLRNAGADCESIHFHLGQRHQSGAYRRAVDHVASICRDAFYEPRFLDCGGGLPSASDPAFDVAYADLESAIESVPSRLPTVEEIWLENGRFITESSTVLVVRVLDVKERADCRYLICDGGRTNQALAADTHANPILTVPARAGRCRLTTVCGPTCMTDDRLGRWELPADVGVGDLIVWTNAGAYHLPWETRFSHGLCAIVWFDRDDRAEVAREREAGGSPAEALANAGLSAGALAKAADGARRVATE